MIEPVGRATFRHHSMMRFSERHGYVPVKSVVQVEEMDDDLRTDLWNVTYSFYFYEALQLAPWEMSERFALFTRIWVGLMKGDADAFPTAGGFVEHTKRWFKAREWYEVYDLVEEFVALGDSSAGYNAMLEKNLAGYRLLDNRVVPIADSHELTEVESALTTERDVVQHHLQQAIRLLADREEPDYPNSIKESISAVEALLAQLVGENTLGKALTKMKKAGGFSHPVLLDAWSKLYGWTSDEDGIRHGGVTIPTADITQDLARYFLITCSAFINLIIADQARRGEAGLSST
ncbi:AbiJ-NTD4 domain-containing protein [Nocardia gipuzkoensis]|uniref:AbiJ-NTD4 domain-containing protein n=1 Tax=Nocardia gipuzkoensis TaxID=2749991 RepID=UPI0015EECEC4|nr:hypothetical protein [Nocardia gipuzkoensis]